MKLLTTLSAIAVCACTTATAETVRFADSTATGEIGDFGYAIYQQSGSLIWEDSIDQTEYSPCSARRTGLYSQNGEGFYSNPDCAGTYEVSRADGASFSLQSVGIAYASDARVWTGPTDYTDDIYDDLSAFDSWASSGDGPSEPQFSVRGYLAGVVVAETTFEDTQDATVISLSDFGNIDAFEVVPLFYGYTYADSIFVLPRRANTGHCYASCYSMLVTDATIGAALTSPVSTAAIPLPATLPMLALGLVSVFGWTGRRKS